MLVALAIPIAQAGELTVADGTDGSSTTTNARVPLYDYCYDTPGTTSRMIYPADMLSDISGETITKITFYFDNRLAFGGGTLSVRMGEVSTTIAKNATSGLTEVWSGSIPTSGSTLEFEFEGFEYNGGNLAIETYVVSKGSYTDGSTFQGIVASDGASFCNKMYDTEYGFLPKVTFEYSGEDAPYAAKVTPSELAFGGLAVGASKEMNVTLKNTGTNAFSPSVTITGAGFSTTYTAAEIASKGTATIPVTFNPTTVGDFTGTLTINCGEAGTFTVELSGSAKMEKTIAEGTNVNEYLPVYGFNHDSYNQQNQMVYPASMLTDLVGKRLKSITFFTGSGTGYYSSTKGLNFKGGSATVSLATVEAGSITFTASGNTPHTPEGLTQVGTVSIPSEAQPNLTEWTISFGENGFDYNGGDLLVDVTTVKGSYGKTYFLGQETDYYAGYSCSSSSAKTGQYFLPQVKFTYEDGGPVPTITATPATVDAFSTEVGTPVTATVNVAGENLTDAITATVSGDDAFSAVLENGVVTITYNPAAAGNHTATLTLSSEGAQDVTIALNGTATAPAVDYAVTISDNSGAHNYGNVLVNSSNVWTLTITNNGTQAVTPTLSGIEAPFSTTYTAATLAAGESATISINFAPTEVNEYSNTITISFPEAGDAIAAYTCVLSGNAVEESTEPDTDDNEVVKLVTVDKRSIYEPNFIDTANGNTTPQQLNCYDMRFKMAQPDDPAKKIKAGDLRPGNNLFEFYAIDDYGTEFRFATINLFAEGQPSSNPSVNAMDAPIKVTPSVEYYTEDGMPVHPSYSHNTTLNYTEKTYNDINELVDLEGVIDYVNDTWSANTATNSHPDHYNFQIRGVGQYGDMVTSLTAEYVESHMTGYGNQLVMPEGWERGSFAGPNNEASDDVHTFYYYDLYIKKSFFDERGITGPVTVVVNTTLSGSGFNADNYKAMSVNGVEQIIAKEEFKDYSWTVPLLDSIPASSIVEQVPMGVIIRLVSTGADFNRTTGIYIYGGGTGVSNIDTVGIYKSSMNVKAYTQKQVDEDTDRSLVAMNAGAKSDVNVLAYADPAVTGYKLYKNTSASTTGITPDNHVASANHESDGDYSVNSAGTYNGRYDFVRDESLGNIDGMWLPMYPADPSKYFLPVTVANGIGDDGVVRSEGNTYGSAMQQVEKNGSVDFSSSKCYKSDFTFKQDGVTYCVYNPEVDLTSELPAATGYQLYNYRLWVDYDDEAPAWDFDEDFNLTAKMDRPLYEGKDTHVGGKGAVERKDNWAFVASNDLNNVKLVARMYYKKTGTASRTARPTDSDRLYYVVEKQIVVPMSQIITGIDDVNMNGGNNVSSVTYYNMTGAMSITPFEGVNVVVTRYTDGTTSTRKVVK